VLIFPWKLIADPGGYIFTWLVGYSSLLGPVGGILIADYYWIRRQQLSVADLYLPDGRYAFTKGFNRFALLSLVLGIVPNIPGFLVTIGVVPAAAVPAWAVQIYSYAWFVGFFVSGGCYCQLMRAYRLAIPVHPYKEEINYVITD
jgi:nucleobase:cation symporter-1, NCS1 family